MCVVADASGHFVLVGDFVGDLQLRFSSDGHDVVVTVHDVQLGQTITVTVSLTGPSGTLQVESREGGDTTENAEGSEKVRLCHLEGNGDYHPITISVTAQEDHLAHGDVILPGNVPGTDLSFDDNCNFPDVDIEKFTNGKNADEAPGPSVTVPATVMWTYEVTNTGSVTLTDITVTDSPEGLTDCPSTTLLSGDSMTCTLSGDAVLVGEYVNTGTVNAKFGEESVTDSDDSHYVGEEATEEEEQEEENEAKVQLCHLTGVPHPVPWTHICAMPPGVAHTPRAPRSAFDTQASRDARSGCTAPRSRPRRRGRPRGSERFGRGSLAP